MDDSPHKIKKTNELRGFVEQNIHVKNLNENKASSFVSRLILLGVCTLKFSRFCSLNTLLFRLNFLFAIAISKLKALHQEFILNCLELIIPRNFSYLLHSRVFSYAQYALKKQ
jgi:hypothetical protein